jgi:hypothetical protein
MQDLLWKKTGGHLMPCQPDEDGLVKLNRKMWEVRKTLLFYHVSSFIYSRSRPPTVVSCAFDGGTIVVFGLIPYENGSWIALAWCVYCKVGFGQFSNKDYGWGDAITFWYEPDNQSYRAAQTNVVHWPYRRIELNIELIEERLNKLIVIGRDGMPTGVAPEAGLMQIDDVPEPEELPASLWDGWMTGFAPGVLSGERSWRC